MAARFRVSVKFVNDMVVLKRETGGPAPRRQGNGGGHGKLEAVKASIGQRMTEKPDLTLDDLVQISTRDRIAACAFSRNVRAEQRLHFVKPSDHAPR